jgi:hypothetical protein
LKQIHNEIMNSLKLNELHLWSSKNLPLVTAIDPGALPSPAAPPCRFHPGGSLV